MTVLYGAGNAVVVNAPDMGEDGVRLRAGLGNVQDVPCLLVDRVASGAHVGRHGVFSCHGDAGVARRDGDRGFDRHHVRVVAEACAARLFGIHDVLDVETLEEPLGRRLDAGILGRYKARTGRASRRC